MYSFMGVQRALSLRCSIVEGCGFGSQSNPISQASRCIVKA